MTAFSPNRLYKNVRDGRFLGVCTGIGDYFGIRPNVIQFAAVFISFMGFFLPVIIGYFILAFVLEDKPEAMYENPKEDKFWQDVRTRPDYTSVDLRRRFRDLERRTRSMEAEVVSSQFKLHREFSKLED